MTEALEAVQKLRRDIRQTAGLIGTAEARYLVDSYYQMQRNRIRAGNQVRALSASSEPHATILWLGEQNDVLETELRKVLDAYSLSRPEGKWARSIVGVGPVIAAGLLAHIDISRAPTVSAVWRFAGLDPTSKWSKGEKRPWNARLKVICWHLGESFKKTSGHERSFYGRFYRERKELEVSRSASGQHAETARLTLLQRSIQDKATRATYDSGKLPAGRLDLRATRYAAKLFLSHFWQISKEIHDGVKPPNPWIIEHGGHVDLVPPPNWPME